MASPRAGQGGVVRVVAWEVDYPKADVETSTTTGATATEAVKNDPDALVLIMQAIGADTVYVGLTPAVSATNGISLPKDGVPLILTRESHGDLVTRAWYAISPAGASTLYSLRVRIAG